MQQIPSSLILRLLVTLLALPWNKRHKTGTDNLDTLVSHAQEYGINIGNPTYTNMKKALPVCVKHHIDFWERQDSLPTNFDQVGLTWRPDPAITQSQKDHVASGNVSTAPPLPVSPVKATRSTPLRLKIGISVKTQTDPPPPPPETKSVLCGPSRGEQKTLDEYQPRPGSSTRSQIPVLSTSNALLPEPSAFSSNRQSSHLRQPHTPGSSPEKKKPRADPSTPATPIPFKPLGTAT